MSRRHQLELKGRYTLPVLTGRVDGPCSRVVWTGARQHGPWTRVSKMTPVLDTRVYGREHD